MKKKKICFVSGVINPFVIRDYEILKKYYDIRWVKWEGKRSIFKLIAGILKSDISFSWFAGDAGSVAVIISNLFRKKSVLVAGGYDVAYIPEISYGRWCQARHKKKMTKYALEKADLVLSVSECNQKELLEKAMPKKNILIYNGVPIDKFSPPKEKKENIAITVGNIYQSNLKKKGIEFFVKAAEYLPDTRFIVIGKFADDSIQYLKSISSKNTEFTDWVSDETLLKYFQRAKVYVQASHHESFGISVAESMLCQCIPVVTKRYALPEVVGDAGFYASYGNEKELAKQIKKALESSDDLGKKARERIIELFSLEQREKKMINAIKKLL